MTRDTGEAQPHPPMPSQPPRPAVPPEPAPPEPSHGPPKWSWWVVGILIPVLGLIVTLVTQSGNNSSRGAGPSVSPAASEEAESPKAPATADASETADPDESPADGVTTPSPSSSPGTAPNILKTGDFTLPQGHSADLEHGSVGETVKAPDMSWPGNSDFSAMNGRVAEPAGGATPTTCEEALTGDEVTATGDMSYGKEGWWYCMPTSANHLAAVEWLGNSKAGKRFHYIVWDKPAPAAAN